MSGPAMRASLLLHRQGSPLLRWISPACSLSNPRRLLHTGDGTGARRSDNSSENVDDFERRLFGFLDNGSNTNSFYRKLDKLEKAQGRSSISSMMNGENSNTMDGLGEGFDTLSDGMDEKLKKAARTFHYTDEIQNDDYSFRPDVQFRPGTTYTPKDLDLTKPAFTKSFKRTEFETTTAEVLKKADFRKQIMRSLDESETLEEVVVTLEPPRRSVNIGQTLVKNVRFLSNFLTESGIIIQRKQTKISAKAQRRVAREIKTARYFGLMPFTTMGTKPFVFGKNMKDEEEEYEYDDYGTGMPDL